MESERWPELAKPSLWLAMAMAMAAATAMAMVMATAMDMVMATALARQQKITDKARQVKA